LTEHQSHIWEVLRRLRSNSLFTRADKCKFHVTSCEYLGYMLSPDGLTMAQNKVQITQDWPEPRKVQDIQSFLGFANFYCRFIHKYSKITLPLMTTTTPVLTHWILDTQITVNTDASDYTLTAILSITTPSGELHLVTFHS